MTARPRCPVHRAPRRGRVVRRLAPTLALAALLAGTLTPQPAQACASCACGDPTLTAMDRELPFAGRLRLSSVLSLRSERAGVPRVSEIEATEQRLTLATSWSPLDALTVALALPVVRRTATEVSGRRHQGYGLADVELRGRWTWSLGRGESRHLLMAHAGLDVPLLPELSVDGVALPLEAQPSTGAFAGMVGAAYGLFEYPWSLYLSASARLSTEGHHATRAGPALLATASLQRQLGTSVAVRLSVDARADAAATEEGLDDPHSGGLLLMVTPELSWSPATDWILSAGLRVPAVVALRGEHAEGWGGTAGVTWDL